jgi:hypothetical protein
MDGTGKSFQVRVARGDLQMRPRHPNKPIETVVQHAESLGGRVEMSHGHAWGFLLCPERSREGCRIGVNSTQSPGESGTSHPEKGR